MCGGGSGRAGKAGVIENTVVGACSQQWSPEPTQQRESSLQA